MYLRASDRFHVYDITGRTSMKLGTIDHFPGLFHKELVTLRRCPNFLNSLFSPMKQFLAQTKATTLSF